MDAPQVTLLVSAIASVTGLVVTLVGIWNTNHKEERARRWALEDIDRLARETRQAKEDLEKKAEHAASETKAHITLGTQDLRELIEEVKKAGAEREKKISGLIHDNTKISEQAFNEANSVNQKLERLGVQLVEDKPHNVIVANTEPINVKAVEPVKVHAE